MNRSPRRSTGKSRRPVLGLLFPWSGGASNRYSLEVLERRDLLASDLELDLLAVEQSVDEGPGDSLMTLSGAEGEHGEQPDLVAFAKALDDAGVTFFGAAWCPHCTDQKQLFGDGAEFLPFVEVTNPDRTPNAIGIAEGISTYPTWEFQGGNRVEGLQTLAQLSQLSGIAIPMSSTPFISPLNNVTLLNGSPLLVSVDGYDPNGDALTYTVSSSNPNVTVSLLQGNRSMRIDTGSYGIMTFELFENYVPRVTDFITDLVEDETYDDVICHRVIDDFVIQCGDPTGTGFGDPSIPEFDDQFHFDLQHNRTGLLSMAKSGDDTNSSQFFITERNATPPPQGMEFPRHLDFNHSVFGVLTDGEAIREAISEVPVNNSDKPLIDITMETVTLFTDTQNRVMLLKANNAAVGQMATITVTATDIDGQQVTETFNVTVQQDTVNGGPFLSDIAPVQTTVGVPAVIQLTANDVEGDAVTYDAVKQGSVDYQFQVNNSTGQVTVTPPTAFVGNMEILVRVKPATTSATTDVYDSQLVTIAVTSDAPDAPTSVDLLASSDSGASNSDNVTNMTPLQFRIDGVLDGALVSLQLNGTNLAQGTANGTTITLSASTLASMGDGQYTLTAVQSVGGVTSPVSPGVTITLDTTAPAAFTSTPPTAATVGTTYLYNAQHVEEGTNGFTYSLVGAPTGATIHATSGQVTWTPTAAQVGDVSFDVVATDLAGNTRVQEVDVDVTQSDATVNIRLQTANLDGTPISEVAPGQVFLLQVFVQDLREFPEVPDGVFAAFLDILYDSDFVTALDFTVGQRYTQPTFSSGDLSVPGLIDEIGSFANVFSLDDEEYLLVQIRMQADLIVTGSEVVSFQGESADTDGTEVLVFNDNVPVPLDQVQYGATSITISGEDPLVDDVFNVDEDSNNSTLDVLDNDDEQVLGTATISNVTTPNHGGTVQIAGDGRSVIYTPAANYFGSELFDYSVVIAGVTLTATVEVQVHPINDPPTANNDSVSVDEDSTNNFIDVQANDSSAPDGTELLEITSVTPGSAGGTITIASNGTHLLYTPAANFSGTETFTYTLSDPGDLTDTAILTIHVGTDPQRPIAMNDTIGDIDEDSENNTLNVLANDSDPQGDTITISAVSTPTQTGSIVTIATNNLSLIYKPAPNFFGTDSFTYTISDGSRTSVATVTVTVDNLNDAPTANDDHHDDNDDLSFAKDSGAHMIDVLDNDSPAPDPTTEALTITAVTQGSAGGTVTIPTGGQSVQYTPMAGFVGTETFTYTITDPGGLTDTAMVTVEVLEFIPRSISGYAPFEGDMTIGGIEVQLSGTTTFGSTLALVAHTNAQGFYTFDAVAPGTYTIKNTTTEMFLSGNSSELTVVTGANDGDVTDRNFQSSGRTARHIGIGDYLSSTPTQHIIASIDTTDGADWYSLTDGWDGIVDLTFDLEANFSMLTITATHQDGRMFMAELDSLAQMGVHLLGSEGTTHLVRIPGGFDDLSFELIDDDDEGDGEGEAGLDAEGESPSALAMTATSPTAATDSSSAEDSSSLLALDAEGESSSTPLAAKAVSTRSTSPAVTSLSKTTTSSPATSRSSSPAPSLESIVQSSATTSVPVLNSDSLAAADDSVWLVDDQLDQPADPRTDDEAVATQEAVDEVMNELGMTNDPKLRTTSLEESVKTTTSEDHADAVDAALDEELMASL